MGRYINNLRRNTTNESLAKSAKGLLKKWRDAVLPDSNGQLKQIGGKEDVNLNELKNKKRPPKEKLDQFAHNKRTKLNGTNEFDFSDNSNSSFKDAININNSSNSDMNNKKESMMMLLNSDSNSSLPDIKNEPLLEQQQPKKRGRKKGSGNHKNLVDEAETSFTNKMAVSRGNAKVKTTQELIASLQNKKNVNLLSSANKRDDLTERAAILTERVSIIDQKLNTNLNRYKSSQKKIIKNNLENKNDKVIESGIVVNISSDKYKSASNSVKSDDEIIVDDDIVDDNETKVNDDDTTIDADNESNEIRRDEEYDPSVPRSLSVEEALRRLPPINTDALLNDDHEVQCSCALKEFNSDFSIDGEDVPPEHKFEFTEDCNCSAKKYLEEKYHLNDVNDERVKELHETFIPCVNGNISLGQDKCTSDIDQLNGLYVNVVPNVNTEHIPKKLYNNNDDSPNFTSENYKKYSISDCASDINKTTNLLTTTATTDSGDNNTNVSSSSESSHGKTFREWHELVETTSYNGEILRILPYVIID